MLFNEFLILFYIVLGLLLFLYTSALVSRLQINLVRRCRPMCVHFYALFTAHCLITIAVERLYIAAALPNLVRPTVFWATNCTRSFLPYGKLFYGELTSGYRSCGGQRQRYKDHLHSVLKQCSIPAPELESLAA